jgi:ATP-dependent helicase/nuclease subunit B
LIRIPTDLGRVLRHGTTVVVPSRQRAHAVRLAYSAAQLQAGRRVWSTPDVVTLEAWITREVEARAAATGTQVPRTLSGAQEWLLWRQCAADATREWDLVNRRALAEALRHASALAADNGIDVHRLPLVPGTEPALLQEVQRAVDERCRALGAASVESAASWLSDNGLTSRLEAAGFLRVSPRLAAFMGVRPGARAGEEQGLKRPKVVIAPDDLTELELIAEWSRVQIARHPEARLLVVLPGSAGARERLATLIQQTLDPQPWFGFEGRSTHPIVAIEGGSPLARNPAVSHALSTLSWLSGEAGDFEAVSAWLRSPYWKVPDAGARARLDASLRERASMQFDLNALAAELRSASPASPGARQIAAQISEAANVLGQDSASPRDWSDRFRAALAVFGWPGDRARNSADQQTVMRFHELLDEFGQLAAAVGSLTSHNAVQCLLELAARTPYKGADDDPLVTITPMFVDPIVRYDAVWVAGLHSEVFPEPIQPDPFLPLPAQLAAGIPAASAAGRLTQARALLRAWRAAAGELVLSAPARSGDLELLPSPLLSPWITSSPRASAPTVQTLWLPERIRRPGWLEAVDDRVGVEWDVDRPLPAGTTSLERQNTCPFRAYAELRLGSAELGAPDPGVDPRTRGKLLHGALQRFWAQVGHSLALCALSEALEGELIERCVSEAARDIWRDAQDPPPRVRERRRAVRLMRSLCKLERERAPFTVTGTELERALILPLKGPLNTATARMNVRIDRIDRLESGGSVILDYKSGQSQSTDWYGERPSHPQLLAYLAAVEEEVVALATVNVTAREVRFDGIARASKLLPKVKGVLPPQGGEGDAWELRKGEWLECVERLAAGFVSGHAAVDPKQGACEHCHVKSVCRVGDRADPELDLLEEMPDE